MRHHLFLYIWIWITLNTINTSGKIQVSTIWLIINIKGLMITNLMDLIFFQYWSGKSLPLLCIFLFLCFACLPSV